MAAILPSCMEVSYCTSGFVVAKPAKKFIHRVLPFTSGLQIMQAVRLLPGKTCSNDNLCRSRPNEHAKSGGTITHLHTWLSKWPPCCSISTVVKKRTDSPLNSFTYFLSVKEDQRFGFAYVLWHAGQVTHKIAVSCVDFFMKLKKKFLQACWSEQVPSHQP